MRIGGREEVDSSATKGRGFIFSAETEDSSYNRELGFLSGAGVPTKKYGK